MNLAIRIVNFYILVKQNSIIAASCVAFSTFVLRFLKLTRRIFVTVSYKNSFNNDAVSESAQQQVSSDLLKDVLPQRTSALESHASIDKNQKRFYDFIFRSGMMFSRNQIYEQQLEQYRRMEGEQYHNTQMQSFLDLLK